VQLDRRLDERKARSPALAFAKRIGFGELKSFWFTLFMLGGPGYSRVKVRLDSRKSPWFELLVDLGEVGLTAKDEVAQQDTLHLAPYRADDLPNLIAATAARAKVAWQEVDLKTSLRGPARQRLRAWLLAE
jgi:hypothetical protein